MARRRFLIAYDICDPKRLRRVIKVMESYGQRLQYLVFLCDLSGQELVDWRTDMLKETRLSEDSVVHIDLGLVSAAAHIGVIGTSRRLPQSGTVII